MATSPLYSIIIPHHAIPDLLIRCLESIPVREDVQVIVVDDNSPEAATYFDKYPELSRPYLEFVRTAKKGGAGYARNVGLDHAKGKWLIFADADDFFVEDFGAILDEPPGDDVEILYFYNKSVLSENLDQPASIGTEYNQLVSTLLKTGEEGPIRCHHWVPWGKIIRRSLITSNNLRFEEIPFANDVVFCSSVNCMAQNIKAVNRFLYVYTQRSDSLSNRINQKPGELQVRAKACFRYHKIIYQYGYTISGRYPISDFLSLLYHQDTRLFRDLFCKVSEVGCSRWAVLAQMRGNEQGIWNKLLLYLKTVNIRT